MSDILTPEQIDLRRCSARDLDGLNPEAALQLCDSHEALRATVARLEQENKALRDGWHAYLHGTNMPRDTQPSSAQEPE